MFEKIDESILEFYLAALDIFNKKKADEYRAKLKKEKEDLEKFHKLINDKCEQIQKDMEKSLQEVLNV